MVVHSRLTQFGYLNHRGLVKVKIAIRFGKTPIDFYATAVAIAEEVQFTSAHCGYYKDKPTKVVTAFFQNLN